MRGADRGRSINAPAAQFCVANIDCTHILPARRRTPTPDAGYHDGTRLHCSFINFLACIRGPQYSPDFNPIEPSFSKVKSHLRKAARLD
jgi:hypothetical protein